MESHRSSTHSPFRVTPQQLALFNSYIKAKLTVVHRTTFPRTCCIVENSGLSLPPLPLSAATSTPSPAVAFAAVLATNRVDSTSDDDTGEVTLCLLQPTRPPPTAPQAPLAVAVPVCIYGGLKAGKEWPVAGAEATTAPGVEYRCGSSSATVVVDTVDERGRFKRGRERETAS